MVARGYTNQHRVADALGMPDVDMLGTQMVGVLLEAAEDWIDIRAGRSWLGTTVTAEPHYLSGEVALIWLRQSPVVAITAVTARTMWVGSAVQTLPPTAYELLDPQRGKVLVSSGYYYSSLAVSYTTNVPVPADISLAAALLVASWARPMITGNLMSGQSMDPAMMRAAGIKSYAIGQDLSVTFQDVATGNVTLQAPIEVQRIVDQYAGVSFA